jgi:hypothetical protein
MFSNILFENCAFMVEIRSRNQTHNLSKIGTVKYSYASATIINAFILQQASRRSCRYSFGQ